MVAADAVEALPITLAVCSNRPDQLAALWSAVRGVVADGDHVLVVMDTPDAPRSLLDRLVSDGVRVLVNEANMGLAFSRNRVLKECQTRHVLYVDDDIRFTARDVERVRQAMRHGLDVIGARITARFGAVPIPWYLGAGQLHYLGSHSPVHAASVWGGFFGMDVERVRLLGVGFDERLGRVGSSLASAEDTTFVREVCRKGASTTVLECMDVAHLIYPARTRLGYLLRRAFWQGRSEQRRGDAWRGFCKEVRRNWRCDGSLVRRGMLTALYMCAVTAGILREVAERDRTGRGVRA